jgi:lysozyme
MNDERLRKQLQRHEGWREKPYKDSVGILTIAWGRNLDQVGVSQAEGGLMLSNDITTAESECEKRFPFFPDLTDIRQEVLTNMMFNLGWPRLKGFKNMIAALEKGDYELAAAEMLDSKWHSQVKSRAEELATQMRTGNEKEEEE